MNDRNYEYYVECGKRADKIYKALHYIAGTGLVLLYGYGLCLMIYLLLTGRILP